MGKKRTYLKILSNLQISKRVKSPIWNGALPETLQQREMPPQDCGSSGNFVALKVLRNRKYKHCYSCPRKKQSFPIQLARWSAALIHGCHLPLLTSQNSHKSICLTEAKRHEKSQLQRKINVIFNLSSFKVEGRHI